MAKVEAQLAAATIRADDAQAGSAAISEALQGSLTERIGAELRADEQAERANALQREAEEQACQVSMFIQSSFIQSGDIAAVFGPSKESLEVICSRLLILLISLDIDALRLEGASACCVQAEAAGLLGEELEHLSAHLSATNERLLALQAEVNSLRPAASRLHDVGESTKLQ